MDHTQEQIDAFKAAVLADLEGPGAGTLQALRAGLAPALSAAELVKRAMTEVGGAEMPELLAWPDEVREIATIEGAAVYCIRPRGIYLWSRHAGSSSKGLRRGYLSIWVTEPHYPPGW